MMDQTLSPEIYARIANLLQTKSPEKDLELFCSHQKELTPHLSDTEVLNYVIMTMVENHNDQMLDFLWSDWKAKHAKVAA